MEGNLYGKIIIKKRKKCGRKKKEARVAEPCVCEWGWGLREREGWVWIGEGGVCVWAKVVGVGGHF